MEIRKSLFGYGYLARINGQSSPCTIARILSINENKYIELLEKYGAKININKLYYFPTYKKAEEFINSDDILPYVIMKKLVK